VNTTTRSRATVKLELFVAGGTQNSLLALANLKAFCREHLPGRCEIEVIDVFKEPERALAEHIFMTPALIRRAPSPARTIIGTLSEPDTLLSTLGLTLQAP
jgi:circadian clock protein KaiB